MDRSVEEEKEIELHENPIPVYPVKVYNKYEIYDSPQWHYVYKVNCLLFLFGLSVGYLLGVYVPRINT